MELEGVTNVQPADDQYEYFFTVSRGACVRAWDGGSENQDSNRDNPGDVQLMSTSPPQDCQLEPKGIFSSTQRFFFFLCHELKKGL